MAAGPGPSPRAGCSVWVRAGSPSASAEAHSSVERSAVRCSASAARAARRPHRRAAARGPGCPGLGDRDRPGRRRDADGRRRHSRHHAHGQRRPDRGDRRRGRGHRGLAPTSSTAPTACRRAHRRRSHLFAGLDRADSVSVDAHKWLFVPKACGILLVRDPAALREAFRHDASYMVEGGGLRPSSRHDDGVLLPLPGAQALDRPSAHGAGAFRGHHHDDRARARARRPWCGRGQGLELLVDAPGCRPCRSAASPPTATPTHNRSLARALQEDGRVYVTSAVVDGVTCLRRASSTSARPAPTSSHWSTSPTSWGACSSRVDPGRPQRWARVVPPSQLVPTCT